MYRNKIIKSSSLTLSSSNSLKSQSLYITSDCHKGHTSTWTPWSSRFNGIWNVYGKWRCCIKSLHVWVHPKSLQSCLTLCDPVDCSLLGSSVHEILQARILEWVAIPPPGDLPDSGIEPASLTSPVLASRFFTTSATWETHMETLRCTNRRIIAQSSRILEKIYAVS